MTKKYTSYPKALDQLELVADNAMQTPFRGRWSPVTIKENTRHYKLDKHGTLVVIHKDITGWYGDPTQVVQRAEVAGKLTRPLRYLGLVRKVKYLSSEEEEVVLPILKKIFADEGRNVDTVDPWLPERGYLK